MSNASNHDEIIEEIRRDLIRQAGTDDPDVIFPISVDSLVTRYVGKPVKEVDGLLDSTGRELSGGLDFDDPQILVNGRLNLAARRFTVAHELAHFWFHEHLCDVHHRDLPGVTAPASHGSSRSIEWEADAVAGAVLVPRWGLRHYMRQRYGTFQLRVAELSEAARCELWAALGRTDSGAPRSLSKRQASLAISRTASARGVPVEPLTNRFLVTDLVIAIELERNQAVI